MKLVMRRECPALCKVIVQLELAKWLQGKLCEATAEAIAWYHDAELLICDAYSNALLGILYFDKRVCA